MDQSRQNHFATTQWSVVLEAGRKSAPDADAALAQLCSVYWFPLYAFARRRGASQTDAADQTQEFFSRLIEKSFLETADPERGRFRTFLLTLFQRFLAKEFDRSHAVKRGGGVMHVPMNFDEGEVRYSSSLSDDQTAEKIFDRQWAMTLLKQVMERLHAEYEARGKASLFEHCRSFLVGSSEGCGYADVARQLKMTEGALRVAVHRIRERYRELLRLEVAGTIQNEQQVDEELNLLRRALQATL